MFCYVENGDRRAVRGIDWNWKCDTENRRCGPLALRCLRNYMVLHQIESDKRCADNIVDNSREVDALDVNNRDEWTEWVESSNFKNVQKSDLNLTKISHIAQHFAQVSDIDCCWDGIDIRIWMFLITEISLAAKRFVVFRHNV